MALIFVLLSVGFLESDVDEDTEARLNPMFPDCNIRSCKARALVYY